PPSATHLPSTTLFRSKQRLAQGSAISAHELSQAETDAGSRTQYLASAEFGAKVADLQLAEAQAALQRGRSGRVDEFEIVAPTSGDRKSTRLHSSHVAM